MMSANQKKINQNKKFALGKNFVLPTPQETLKINKISNSCRRSLFATYNSEDFILLACPN